MNMGCAGLPGCWRIAIRTACGMTSLRSSSRFVVNSADWRVSPVALPLGRARLATKPLRIGHRCHDDGDALRRRLRRLDGSRASGHDDVECLAEWIVVRSSGPNVSDARGLLTLLRMRRERPRSRCSADKRDEVAPFHCPMPSVLPTERVTHLGTADCCIYPPGRYATIAVTPPIIFSQGGSPKTGYPTSPPGPSSLPEIVSKQVFGDGARMNFHFSHALPHRGLRAPRQERWQRFLSPKLPCDALDRASPDPERLGNLQDSHTFRKLLSHLPTVKFTMLEGESYPLAKWLILLAASIRTVQQSL